MYFEKQILGVLRNEVGPDACDNVVLVGDMNNDCLLYTSRCV